VIVLDANLPLYAYLSASPLHAQARAWLRKVFSEPGAIGLPWLSVWAFLRVSTNTRITLNPVSMNQAIEAVESWFELPHVQLLSPGERHWPVLKQMLLEGQVRGPAATDAQLAAITIEHGGILHTTDRGFARFPGLRWVNPLDSA
jgi:uncharacterized protein